MGRTAALYEAGCTAQLESLPMPFEDRHRLVHGQRGGIHALQLGGTTHRREDALGLGPLCLGFAQLGNVPLAPDADEARQYVLVRWGQEVEPGPKVAEQLLLRRIVVLLKTPLELG